ncbi:hypothetical protein AALO_G00076460 [Alosa alosa]|uniref:Extracellular matrix protein 1 n=1 Tax=Alosa alosa TaxID=278164 RepID=A0AAV6GW27_9TELE|nr:extracellular matrix protein 1-like [Alosa alosa]KAG5279318.1 hypothetical protein AALO_G00076460 [Alosa alosa]
MALTRILGLLLVLALFECLASAAEDSVDFPPGCPTAENIQEICGHSKTRPRYPNLPNHGYLLREADVIHRTEAWYSQQCCQGNWEQNTKKTVCCAQNAWKKALALLCEEEGMIKTIPHQCCLIEGAARWRCFDSMAPNPSYQTTTPYSGPDVLPKGPAFKFPSTCSAKEQHHAGQKTN